MKLNLSQLKQIIKEEVQKATLKEELASRSTGSAELQTLLDVVCDGWKAQFDPQDPSMDASGGKPVWNAQCDEACEILGEKIEELIMKFEEDLHLGQFYKEPVQT
jgi:hypothetical protein